MGIARGLAKYLADEQKIDAPARGLTALMAKTPEPAWLLLSPGVWLLLGLAVVAAASAAALRLGRGPAVVAAPAVVPAPAAVELLSAPLMRMLVCHVER